MLSQYCLKVLTSLPPVPAPGQAGRCCRPLLLLLLPAWSCAAQNGAGRPLGHPCPAAPLLLLLLVWVRWLRRPVAAAVEVLMACLLWVSPQRPLLLLLLHQTLWHLLHYCHLLLLLLLVWWCVLHGVG
jgi:hypothetical protein